MSVLARMHSTHDSGNKNGQRCCPFNLAQRSGINYLLQCSTAIGVAVLLPFLGVSSLNFGPLATAAFFLGCSALATYVKFLQVDYADGLVFCD
jgi:hypothetical protein